MLAALVLAGCGFHLRGGAKLPEGIDVVYLSGGSEALSSEVAEYVKIAGASVTDRAEDADAILAISGETFGRRLLSVDPNTGKEREFELSYALTFALRDPSGRPIVGDQPLKLLRDYVFYPDQVIGKSREQNVIQDEMVRDAAEQILSRLSIVLQE